MVRVHDLHLLLDLLGAAGIETLAFKGPVLDAELRGNPCFRESDDLDLLVPRESVFPTLDLLAREGWVPALDLHPRNYPALLRYGCELPLAREGRTLLDLHWELTPAYFSWRPDPAGLRARARSVPVAGRAVPTLSRPDAFLHLCAHGCLSDWSRGIWVQDIAVFLGSLTAEEAAAVLEGARRTGGLRMTAVAVHLAELQYGASATVALRARDFADPEAEELASFYDAVLDGDRELPPDGAARVALHLRARERLRDRARHVAGILQTPSVDEWREPPVAAPVRWARRISRGLRGGGGR